MNTKGRDRDREGNFRAAGIFFRYQIPRMNLF